MCDESVEGNISESHIRTSARACKRLYKVYGSEPERFSVARSIQDEDLHTENGDVLCILRRRT